MRSAIRRRSGVAALFDALMFLSVMSVVSVTVLVAFSPALDGEEGPQSYLQRCHSVLLGTTLNSWSESSAKLMSVSDAISTLLFLKKQPPERIHTEIDQILQGLFQPQYDAQWECTLGETCFVFGSILSKVSEGDVFVSSFSVSAPSGPCGYVLTVRYA